MQEPNPISPMLDNFAMGGSISDHDGVACFPAMENGTDGKFIVKVVSLPASPEKLDALLISGAYSSKDAALAYFKELADGIVKEAETISSLSKMEGYLPFRDYQCIPREDGTGYEVHLLSAYRRTLAKQFSRKPLTQLEAVNLGLDLCAALALSRHAGYLYVGLKPNNIYLADDNSFKIGDLGFMPLSSLQYASLPDRYRSQYTAPEIADAFSALNATMDVYAAGLILYQVYNSGMLPFDGASAPAEAFPAPAYADYEMSGIILKACAPTPEERWASPVEMGQALVAYMQRNDVNDTPIIPSPGSESEVQTEESSPEELGTESPAQTDSDLTENLQELAEESEDVISEEDGSQVVAEELAAEEQAVEPIAEEQAEEPEVNPEAASSDEEASGLSSEIDETLPTEADLDISYNELSDEVSSMLSQADELVSHPVPEPAVAPDPIEVQIPEPDTKPEAVDIGEMDTADINEIVNSVANIEAQNDVQNNEKSANDKNTKKSGHWLRNSLIVLGSLAAIAGLMLFYRFYYLLPVEGVSLEGKEDTLIVHVKSSIDDSMLTVVCTDTYGTKLSAPVVEGKASFTDLVSDTGYTVSVEVSGFHKLTGSTSAAYSTPVQSKIVQFSAITGAENGSVILGFTVEGPDSEQWTVTYSAEGEEEKILTFPSHTVTITGLTVGKEYTFRLMPEEELFVSGEAEVKHVAKNLIYPKDVKITALDEDSLTASWSAPKDVNVDSWTVRCFNTEIYNETIVTKETSAVFEGLDPKLSYTVEVTAEGMSVAERAYISEGAIILNNVKTELTAGSDLVITWDTEEAIPENGWTLDYISDHSNQQQTVICKENKAVISPVVPGEHYKLHMKDVDGRMVMGIPGGYDVPDAEVFSCTYEGATVKAEDITFKMCRQPNRENWTRRNLKSSDYRTTFKPGQKAGFLAKIETAYGQSDDPITVLFVTRNSEGMIVNADTFTDTWKHIWMKHYAEFNVPNMPEVNGDYTMNIYFNGDSVAEVNFKIAN